MLSKQSVHLIRDPILIILSRRCALSTAIDIETLQAPFVDHLPLKADRLVQPASQIPLAAQSTWILELRLHRCPIPRWSLQIPIC